MKIQNLDDMLRQQAEAEAERRLGEAVSAFADALQWLANHSEATFFDVRTVALNRLLKRSQEQMGPKLIERATDERENGVVWRWIVEGIHARLAEALIADVKRLGEEIDALRGDVQNLAD